MLLQFTPKQQSRHMMAMEIKSEIRSGFSWVLYTTLLMAGLIFWSRQMHYQERSQAMTGIEMNLKLFGI
jgi:hypothetical protein